MMEVSDMTDRELMQRIPDSYSDFVDSMCQWMNRDGRIRSLVMEQLHRKPDSDTQDLMGILWDYLGIGDPVEYVDEDEYESGYEDALILGAAGMRAAY